ncbi:hypothetical protein OUZ56_032458 [Daphnia magna]|uniref:Uncharacterized protein n=1 Tax=Daphnia magna TaxID=35525 RepID=A0ABR0B8Y2_9CRUS|nr:hypothetical protein OUZ56_032458 [Daphnia magna]
MHARTVGTIVVRQDPVGGKVARVINAGNKPPNARARIVKLRPKDVVRAAGEVRHIPDETLAKREGRPGEEANRLPLQGPLAGPHREPTGDEGEAVTNERRDVLRRLGGKKPLITVEQFVTSVARERDGDMLSREA